MKLPAYWDGKKVEIEVIRIRLVDSPDVPLLYWGKPFYGEERQAIRVFTESGSFVIDNEDGMGYRKVTVGYGSFTSAHRSVFAYEEIGPEAPIDIKPWNPMKYEYIEHKIRSWQEANHPEEAKKMRMLEATIDNMNQENRLRLN